MTDALLVRSHTFITPMITDYIVMFGNTAQHCPLGLISGLESCWRPRGLQINLEGNLMNFRKSNICSHKLDVQETNVSFSQFQSVGSYFVGCLSAGHCMRNRTPSSRKGNQDVHGIVKCGLPLSQTDNGSQGESQLYIFEDNEAVIKMMIKGRSPTMRHVSRTHRVAPDRLFDRINSDPTNPNLRC